MPGKTKKFEFAVYIGPANVETDLEPMKLYRLLPAEPRDPKDHLRVIDESGEDYLYPARLFAPISVPKSVEAAMPVTA
ncbi:MAG: hypothetical protein ACYC26_01390 [Phycisphaerales bacterium]